MRKSVIILCGIIILFSSIAKAEVANIKYDIFWKYEEFLRSSDLIVSAHVIKSELNSEYDDTIYKYRVTTFLVDKQYLPINAATTLEGKTIQVKTVDKVIENGKPLDPPYTLEDYTVGSEKLLLLKKRDGLFQPISHSYGVFAIKNGKVESCGENVTAFTDEIISVLSGTKKQFERNYPDYYYNSIRPVNKVASAVSLPNLTYQFRPEAGIPDDFPIKIHFYINPAGGYGGLNGDSLYIGLPTLVQYVREACEKWNTVACGLVELSVDDSATTLGFDASDGVSVISFGTGTDSAHEWGPFRLPASYPNVNYTSDIEFDSYDRWPLLMDIKGGNFTQTIVHEMGHSLFVGDLDANTQPEEDDPEIYSNNLMWHSGDYYRKYDIYDPQLGDMLGLLYNFHDDLSGTLDVYDNRIIRNGRITDDLTIPAGMTLEIDGPVTVASGSHIYVYGTLQMYDGSLTKVPGGSNWGGIVLESGGTIDIQGNATISNANWGITMFDEGLSVSGGCRLTIADCARRGISVYGASPDFSNIFLDNCGTYNSDYALDINSSVGSTDIYFITVQNSIKGVGVYAGITGDFMGSDLQISNTGASLTISSYSNLDVGYNNICPTAGQYGIDNSTSAYIRARNNWWGFYPPVDSLFSSPERVLCDAYQIEPIPPEYAGAPKISPYLVAQDPFTEARSLEQNRDWAGAIRAYHTIISSAKSSEDVKNAIQRMIRAHDKSDKNYSDVRQVILGKRASVDDVYVPQLDFILCELLAREGDVGGAIVALEKTSKTYAGTWFEAEMLSRIAVYYGANLRDKGKAKEYADRAAALNPGQHGLIGAYASADIEYNPNLYVDKFGAQDAPEKPREEAISKAALDVVSISPNPFNPATTISYAIPASGRVTLTVYSVTGQKVATLVDDVQEAGGHSVVFDGKGLSSGVYLYRLETAGAVKTGRMLMVK